MTKPRVCLINPPHPYLINPTAQAPLGLLYLAAMLRQRGFPVQLCDLSGKHYRDEIEVPSAEVYGITGTALDLTPVTMVISYLRSVHRHAKIVLGGPIALVRNRLDWDVTDAVVVGEGEYTFLELLEEYPDLTRRVYQAERIENLDKLPFPARDLLGTNLGGDVFAHRKRYFEGGSTVFITSRGCTFGCTFCASPALWDRHVTYRSAENVVEEIEEVVKRYHVRQFRFSDDNLTAKRQRLLDICNRLAGQEIAWRASIRVRPADPEMFQAMKAAGCVEVCFGIESGDDDVLRALKKGATVAENEEAIVNAHQAGLDVRILFMIGTPGETTQTVDRNVAFLERVRDHFVSIALTNFAPLPGCAIAVSPEENQVEILNHNLDDYNLCMWGPEGQNKWQNLIRPYGLSDQEVTSNKERMIGYLLGTGKINRG